MVCKLLEQATNAMGDTYKLYPTGIRYEVRCLTGGAWDRSSSQGMFSSLEEAIEKATSELRLFGYM